MTNEQLKLADNIQSHFDARSKMGFIPRFNLEGDELLLVANALRAAIRPAPTDAVTRCAICDWPLADSWEKGCVPGNCSYRPDDPAEQNRIAKRRAALTSPAVAREAVQRAFDVYESYVRRGQTATPEQRMEVMGVVLRAVATLPSEAAQEGVGSFSLVCSNKPRPSVQKGAKGSQFWKRDVHHVARKDHRTLCGIDAAEWLTIGPCTSSAGDSPDLCVYCKTALSAQSPLQAQPVTRGDYHDGEWENASE